MLNISTADALAAATTNHSRPGETKSVGNLQTVLKSSLFSDTVSLLQVPECFLIETLTGGLNETHFYITVVLLRREREACT